MLSDRPAMPGRRQQMPRTTAITFTPADDAWYSRSISVSSTSELSFSHMPAGLPACAKAISRLISSASTDRVVSGLNASASIFSGLA
jgi:hypothetical protein